MNVPENPSIDAFLRKVRQGLASLPAAEREDIVAELCSHLQDRQAQGNADPLAGFGSPERLAADFVSEYALRGALTQGTSWALGKALFVAGRNSVRAVLVLGPLLVLQLCAVAFLVAAALKPFAPGMVGVWVDGGEFYAGIGHGHAAMREVLGWWSLPLFALTGALLFWLSNRAMLALVRRRLRAGHLSPG